MRNHDRRSFDLLISTTDVRSIEAHVYFQNVIKMSQNHYDAQEIAIIRDALNGGCTSNQPGLITHMVEMMGEQIVSTANDLSLL